MSCDSLPKKITIRILFFAKSRELSGVDEVSSFALESGSISSFDLLSKISSTYNLEAIKSTVILAVNQSYCEISQQEQLNLQEGDEIAIIPPLSGG